MIRLKEFCKGPARELIHRITNNESGYRVARKLLEETYGGSARGNSRYLNGSNISFISERVVSYLGL